MSTPLKPLADFIVAQQEDAVTKTASGLYLPDKSTEKPKIAKVLAVGPGKVGDDNKRIPVGVKKGDRVVYRSYGPTEVKIDDKEYVLIKEDDILAVIEDEDVAHQKFKERQQKRLNKPNKRLKLSV